MIFDPRPAAEGDACRSSSSSAVRPAPRRLARVEGSLTTSGSGCVHRVRGVSRRGVESWRRECSRTRRHGLSAPRSRGIWRPRLSLFAPADRRSNGGFPDRRRRCAIRDADGQSGLPVPRFVSLKAGRVNVRVGPGEDYKVAWVFTKPGLPIEVIQEFDNWRRIRDSDGRSAGCSRACCRANAPPWSRPGRAASRGRSAHRPRPTRAITAYLQPGVMGEIERCRDGWCRIAGTASPAGSRRTSSGASIPTRRSTDDERKPSARCDRPAALFASAQR